MFADLCASCKRRHAADAYAQSDGPAQDYVRRRARAELRKANVPTAEVHVVHTNWQTKRFGGGRFVDVVTPAGRGWIIGKMTWNYNSPGNYGGTDHTGPVLTMLLDAEPSSDTHSDGGLVRVSADRDRGGFTMSTSYGSIRGGWSDAMAAIQTLIESSTDPKL